MYAFTSGPVKNTFASINAGTTDGSVIAAVAGAKLRVLAVVLQCAGTATTATFNTKPSGAGSAISMTFANGANGGAVLPFNPYGWFETGVGQGLSLTTGAGSATGVQVTYTEA